MCVYTNNWGKALKNNRIWSYDFIAVLKYSFLLFCYIRFVLISCFKNIIHRLWSNENHFPDVVSITWMHGLEQNPWKKVNTLHGIMYVSLRQHVFLKTCEAIIRNFIILYDIPQSFKRLPIPLEKDHFIIIVAPNTNNTLESYVLYCWKSSNTSGQ